MNVVMTTDTKERRTKDMGKLSKKETIELEDGQAAMVFLNDGTVDMYLPEPEDDELANQAHLLCTAVAHMIVERGDMVIEALDEVIEACDELEKDSVSSDTDCCGSEDCDCTKGEPV